MLRKGHAKEGTQFGDSSIKPSAARGRTAAGQKAEWCVAAFNTHGLQSP